MPANRRSWQSSHSSSPPLPASNAEQQRLRAQLERQQQDSAADSEWLRNSERNMKMPVRHSSNSNLSTNGAQASNMTGKPQKVDLDRTNDDVFKATTSVVRSVMALSKEVSQNKQADYLELVKNVGVELRTLLAGVDSIINKLPTHTHSNIAMAHKVLGSDMSKLVSAMKIAQKYLHTTMSEQYEKKFLAAAHALAMNAKYLLDEVDAARIALIQSNSFS